MPNNHPAKYAGLTEMQAEFVRLYGIGIPQGEAALGAGYSRGEEAWSLLQLPRIQDAIHRALQLRLRTTIAQKALDRLEECLEPGAMPKAKLGPFIKLATELAGHAVEQGQKISKDLNEMSGAELVEIIRKGKDAEEQAALQALDVTPHSAQDTAPLDAQPEGEQGESAT